jgi:anti-sigma B factor antagonist
MGRGDIVLRERVGELLQQSHQCILLNLAEISYMDSCGLAELVSCQRLARENRAEIKLLSPSVKVHDLLAVTKLDQILETFRDEKEALASFSSRRRESRP